MSEFQDIQRLIRLKRFEAPAEDFVEDFLIQFHQRQRSELLRQSARGLLWERMTMYFDSLFVPKWSMAAATGAFAVVAAFGATGLISRGPDTSSQVAALASQEMSGSMLAAKPKFDVTSPLISEIADRHPSMQTVLLSQHFENDSAEPLGNFGTSHDILPVSLFGGDR